jgi:hypothetical protein
MSILLWGSGVEAEPGSATAAADLDTSTDDADDDVLTASVDTVVDKFGLYSLVSEDGAESEAGSGAGDYINLGPTIQAFPFSGLYNGDFLIGPPRPDLPIGDENPLPYWTWVRESGSSMEAYWVTDDTAPGGHAVAFSCLNGQADDKAYFEQVIPVIPADLVRLPILRMGADSVGAVSGLRLLIEAECFDHAGLSVGTETSSHDFINYAESWDAGERRRMAPIGLPPTARYLRVRIGMECSSAPSAGPHVAYFEEVTAIAPRLAWMTIVGSGTSLPSTGDQTLYLTTGNESGTPVNSFTANLMPPAMGWVVAVSATLSDFVDGADLEVAVYDPDRSIAIGPVVTIPEFNTYGYSRSPFDVDAFFGPDTSRLRFQSNVPTGTITSTGRDIVAHAVLALVIDDVWEGYF